MNSTFNFKVGGTFILSRSWSITLIVYSCLLSTLKSNRRTIAANGMLGEKLKFARVRARTKPTRVPIGGV